GGDTVLRLTAGGPGWRAKRAGRPSLAQRDWRADGLVEGRDAAAWAQAGLASPPGIVLAPSPGRLLRSAELRRQPRAPTGLRLRGKRLPEPLRRGAGPSAGVRGGLLRAERRWAVSAGCRRGARGPAPGHRAAPASLAPPRGCPSHRGRPSRRHGAAPGTRAPANPSQGAGDVARALVRLPPPPRARARHRA